MIAIINKGDVGKGIYKYFVQINNELITTFEHKRSDGLSVCLKKASEAVKDSRMWGFINTLEQLNKLEEVKTHER